MAVDDGSLMGFANDTGVEMFELLLERSQSLGDRRFDDMLSALMGAVAVCMANVLHPAVEASPNRATAADQLIAAHTSQVLRFLGPVIEQAD